MMDRPPGPPSRRNEMMDLRSAAFPLVWVAAAAPAAAQELAPGSAMPRTIEFAAPEGTFLFVRGRGLHVDVAGLRDLARRLLGRGGPLAELLDADEARQARAGLLRLAGVERNAIGAAIEELAQGEVAFGLRLAGTPRPVPFLLGRARDEAGARRLARPFARVFGLPMRRKGTFVYLTHGRSMEPAIADTIARVRRGRGPTRIGARIGRELVSRAPLAAWLDLGDSRAGKFLSSWLRRRPEQPAAAYLAGGLGSTIANARSLVAEARFAWDRIAIQLRAPDVRDRMPGWVAEILGLAEPAFPDLPELEGMLARFRLSRSLARYLEHRQKVAGQRAQKAIQSFLANVELFFRGTRAERDIFPQIRPGLAGIATLPRADDPRPAQPYRLPTAAFVSGLTHVGRFANALEGAMQVILAGRNSERRRNGKLLFRLRGKKGDGLRVLYSEQAAPAGGRPVPTDATFAPVLARSDKHFTIGFSKSLCTELLLPLRRAPEPVRPAAGRRVLDMLDVRFANVAQSLLQNRVLIESRLLLDRGFGFERAGAWVDALADLVRMAGRATLQSGLAGKDWFLSLDWRPNLASAQAPEEGR